MLQRTRERMDDDEITSVVSAEIADAINFEKSELDQDRAKAIEYYRGEMKDLPAEPGRSSVVDHTVQDVIGWVLPGLMRVFFSGGRIVEYEPTEEDDMAGAAQATDYVNHIVVNECDAYQVFWDCFHDALLHRNGVLKHFWDSKPEEVVEVYSCLSDDQKALILDNDKTEVLEHSERDPVMTETPEGPVPVIYYDMKVRTEIDKGKLVLAAVPPENFLINRSAVDIEDARFVGERLYKTRSELIEMGFDRDLIEGVAADAGRGLDDATQQARHGDSGELGGEPTSKATEEIEFYETYPLVDVDGDGIAERLKVLSIGPDGSKMLDWEVWEDEVPYSDLTPERVPHRWEGRSVFDDTNDIQRIKSFLMRQVLDNLYESNVPDRAVDLTRIDNPDALHDRRIGNILHTKGDPSTVVANLPIPFTAAQSFAALEYMDQVIEKRTGVSRSSMGLDPEVLQNQSATAATIQQSASYSKIELIARNFAEMGMKRAFRSILKLVVKHQDRPRTIRLRNQWVEMDPRGWNADMDATINTGLGSGSRDRDMMFLSMILEKQMQVVATVGGMATTFGQKMAKAVHHTLTKMVEASGLKSADSYFPELGEQDMAEIAEASKQNPEMQKMQAEAELKQQEMQQKAEIEKLQANADIEVKNRDTQAQIALKDREFGHKAQLEMQKFEFDKQLKLIDLWIKGQAAASQPGDGEEGQPKRSSGVPMDMLADLLNQNGGKIDMGMVKQAMTPPPSAMDKVAESMTALAKLIQAPNELIRDPKTGRPVGSRKVMQ